MHYKLRDVIDKIDDAELLKMQKDLAAGGIHLQQFLDQKIKERRDHHDSLCVTCHAPLNPQSTSSFTLVFGPHDFRKKASFCAQDCLESFLIQLKEMKHEQREQHHSPSLGKE